MSFIKPKVTPPFKSNVNRNIYNCLPFVEVAFLPTCNVQKLIKKPSIVNRFTR